MIFFQPHVEESGMFPDYHRTSFHVLGDITAPTTDGSGLYLEGSLVQEIKGSVESSDI